MKINNTRKTTTLHGIIWSFLDFSIKGIGYFVVNIILARKLNPNDYGLFGMLTIFITMSNLFIDSGFSQGLIRKKEVSNQDYSTVFIFNLFVSIIIYFLLYFTSNLISNFYSEPDLIPIIKVLSLTLIINAFSIIPKTILTRKLDFKSQAKITLISSLFSGIISIILAYSGFGVWSLIFQTLLTSFFQSSLLMIKCKWSPHLIFNIKIFKDLFKFGSNLLYSGLLDAIYRNISSVIIGRIFTAEDVGYYSNADNLKNQISSLISNSVERVSYPMFSSIKDDENDLMVRFRSIFKVTMFFSFPFLLGLASISEPLFLLILGEKWENSIIFFKLLCIVGIFYPLQSINLNILKVVGRSDLFLKLEILKKIVHTIFLALFFRYGIIGLIIAQIISATIGYFINNLYTSKFCGYSTKNQIKDIIYYFIFSILMAFLILTFDILLLSHLHYLIRIITEITLGIIFYIVCCGIFIRNDCIFIFFMFKNFFKNNK